MRKMQSSSNRHNTAVPHELLQKQQFHAVIGQGRVVLSLVLQAMLLPPS